jgi:hypothetical protein
MHIEFKITKIEARDLFGDKLFQVELNDDGEGMVDLYFNQEVSGEDWPAIAQSVQDAIDILVDADEEDEDEEEDEKEDEDEEESSEEDLSDEEVDQFVHVIRGLLSK